MPRYRGRVGQGRREEPSSPRPGRPSSHPHTTTSILARGETQGPLHSPSHPRLQPGSWFLSGGAPPLVPMVWGILECLGNQGRLDLPTGGGMERKGCTQTLDEGDERGWGAVGVLGSWQGWGAGGRGRDRWSYNCIS